MQRSLRTVVAIVVLTLASGWLSGCARQVSNAPFPQSPSDTARATFVELVQSGGESGTSQTWEVSAKGTPPKGMSVAEARDVLRIASSEEFRSSTPEKVLGDYCCDRFHYNVTVRYSDGSTAHHETADGLEQPEPLTTLISAFDRAGR